MRIRWRGLELPSKVLTDPKFKSDTFGRFSVEPFERGFGTTIGNSLRRILLSSLEGAAVTAIKIKGAQHEFTSLPGVLEDVSVVKGIATIPEAAWELLLGIYLTVKGFRPSAVAALYSAR